MNLKPAIKTGGWTQSNFLLMLEIHFDYLMVTSFMYEQPLPAFILLVNCSALASCHKSLWHLLIIYPFSSSWEEAIPTAIKVSSSLSTRFSFGPSNMEKKKKPKRGSDYILNGSTTFLKVCVPIFFLNSWTFPSELLVSCLGTICSQPLLLIEPYVLSLLNMIYFK